MEGHYIDSKRRDSYVTPIPDELESADAAVSGLSNSAPRGLYIENPIF